MENPRSAVGAVGPTGLAYDRSHDTPFVASTADNKIFAISDPADRTSNGTGAVVFADQTNQHGPLGLTLAPNGNLIAANLERILLQQRSNLFESHWPNQWLTH